MNGLRLLLGAWLGLALGAQDTTVILLHHAERRSRRAEAELTGHGRRRAEALAEELAPFAPAALYASEYLRTRLTLEPLARRLALGIRVRPRGGEAALARELLREHPGTTVVVCAHSDRLGPLMEALGHPNDLAEVRDHDRLWILRLPPQGPLRVEERRQGLRDR